jgi:4a-hydroxytetrahydrobiopterin dehydratase
LLDNVPKSRDAFKGQPAEVDMKLKEKRCVPCEGGTPPLADPTIQLLLGEVPGWVLRPEGGEARIGKSYTFDDFLGAMAFVDRMAALAEDEGHHPDFCVHYSRVDVTLWTHAVKGLSENDFILASKLDAIFS